MNYIALSLNETVAFLGGVASIFLITAALTAWTNWTAYKQRKRIIELLEDKQ